MFSLALRRSSKAPMVKRFIFFSGACLPLYYKAGQQALVKGYEAFAIYEGPKNVILFERNMGLYRAPGIFD